MMIDDDDASFFLIFQSKKIARSLHKNDCERKLFYTVNEKDTRQAVHILAKTLKLNIATTRHRNYRDKCEKTVLFR